MGVDLQGLLKEKVFIMDGAMGTMLQEKGMGPGECPELFGVNHAEILADIHRQYVDAGADIIETNTFGGNRYKLAEYGLADRVGDINAQAVRIAKSAARGKALVAASIGPSGRLLRPMGDVGFDDLYQVFSEQIVACEKAGADLISIETMTDVGEARVAAIAALSNSRLPVIVHMSFESGGRTMMGTDPSTALIILEALQPLAIGANCSGGGRELIPVIAEMSRLASVFLSVEPNAGLPTLVDGQTVFPDSPEEMAEYALGLREAGAAIIGGCCGSTPRHIKAIADTLRGLPPGRREKQKWFALASRSQHIILGPDHPLAFIGERINPTARKKLAEDIREGRMQMVVDEARRQVAAGAPVLDVNMGVPGIDEARAMARAVTEIQAAVDVPLSLDSTNVEALEEGLKNFVGRPLINSTTGEAKNLEAVLPLARKYGAAVLGLCLDEQGIPEHAAGRVEVARRIKRRALEAGLREEDIYIDCLVKTASAEQSQVMETLEALRTVKGELGVGTVLGVSNVSHGLPAREILNSTYLAMAWAAGVDLPIVNPFDERMMDATRGAAVLLNRDPACSQFITRYREWQASAGEKAGLRHAVCRQCNIPDLISRPAVTGEGESPARGVEEKGTGIEGQGDKEIEDPLYRQLATMVLEGEHNAIETLVNRALEELARDPLEVVNQALIPGIEKAGELYDQKVFFLPQLMMAAEAMKRAFTVIRPRLKDSQQVQRGTIVMATVEGDIHDIGKNIVCVLLENYGFRVIDLGKDVATERIIATAEQEQADIVGLSALMTTTMPVMKRVIAGLKEKGLACKTMVGGAVLTLEYAQSIGADAYSRDAREAVRVAQKLLG